MVAGSSDVADAFFSAPFSLSLSVSWELMALPSLELVHRKTLVASRQNYLLQSCLAIETQQPQGDQLP
jgi:hypothetical protein